VVLSAVDGTSAEGALLVGADGLCSRVRKQLLADGPPRYAGYTSWRGLVAADLDPSDEAVESWGRGSRFGIVPVGGGRVYWYATANAEPGADDQGRAALAERFAGFHPPVPSLIEATLPASIVRTDIHDRPPARRWSHGPVTLLGDAAHPMTPNLGQGGCQAMEDAFVLAAALAEEATVAGALARYERERLRRANRIVSLSRRFGAVAQWRSALACAVRDLGARWTPGWLLDRRMRRIYRP
jgi:2-polyprenyl-6-methoxyphenol hydroxylase-like FAD-dependent oxidoreductase